MRVSVPSSREMPHTRSWHGGATCHASARHPLSPLVPVVGARSFVCCTHFRLKWLTRAELQPADIAIQQPLKHSIKQQAMQFFAESVYRNDAVLTCASAP